MTDEVFVQYVVRGNSDQTEGRGYYVDREFFVKLEDAVSCVKSGKHGVQGVKGDGLILERKWRIIDGVKWEAKEVTIWGYRRDKDNRPGHGFMDLRDSEALANPEYVEYLRLKEVYG